MQQSTKNKIIEIQKMLSDGITEKDIIKMKFKSSPKAYKEWLDKFGSYLTVKQETTLVIEEKEQSQITFIPTEKDIIKLKSLLENADDLLSLLNTKQEIEELHVLEVPEELLKLYDVKISSLRISKAIEDRFNKFVDKNKKYSKTSLINMALVEFLDKYE
ncbi:MAG: hypothetical protein ACRCX7_00025 [Cetobacterium sp.]|uniref:hypothetical protein n=1 Tax=Cetobacterium sp. TaxID=2071632 RepID=UPI003F3D5DF8